MLARDIMSTPLVTAHETDTLEVAARRMVERNVGCLPVLNDAGKMIGILTEADFQAQQGYAPFSLFVMPRLFGQSIDAEGLQRIYAQAQTTPVSQLMQRHPVTLPDDAVVEEVARAMLEHGCHHVPLLRRGKPIGIVARRDMLRLLIPGAATPTVNRSGFPDTPK